MSSVMSINGLRCTLHLPEAVKRKVDSKGKEIAVGLPPYAPISAYAVDEYPASPDSWMHGSSVASSYFLTVAGNRGMWLDLTENSNHSHHVAAVVSVQGINPLTGMKADPIRLEQYREMCPKHQKEFKQDLFCEDCKFKWHAQNYLASNTGQAMWIDGFRTEEGVIRQYYFTEEEAKGVAAQLLGEERVFAIGIAFYLSKDPKPQPKYDYHMEFLGGPDGGGLECCSLAAPIAKSLSARSGLSLNSAPRRAVKKLKNIKQLEIGAGAKIHQAIGRDPENLDFWKDEPEGFLYINYCDEATVKEILAAGKREDEVEGFLSNVSIKDME